MQVELLPAARAAANGIAARLKSRGKAGRIDGRCADRSWLDPGIRTPI
jgi:hypothetical protein